MGLEQPAGRIVMNTGAGNCEKVDPSEISEYSFIGDGRVHRYDIDGELILANRFTKAIKKLKKLEL